MPLRELMRDIIEQGYEGYCTVELVTMYERAQTLCRQALEPFARCCRRMRDENRRQSAIALRRYLPATE